MKKKSKNVHFTFSFSFALKKLHKVFQEDWALIDFFFAKKVSAILGFESDRVFRTCLDSVIGSNRGCALLFARPFFGSNKIPDLTCHQKFWGQKRPFFAENKSIFINRAPPVYIYIGGGCLWLGRPLFSFESECALGETGISASQSFGTLGSNGWSLVVRYSLSTTIGKWIKVSGVWLQFLLGFPPLCLGGTEFWCIVASIE